MWVLLKFDPGRSQLERADAESSRNGWAYIAHDLRGPQRYNQTRFKERAYGIASGW
jgi:hypothetical protein